MRRGRGPERRILRFSLNCAENQAELITTLILGSPDPNVFPGQSGPESGQLYEHY